MRHQSLDTIIRPLQLFVGEELMDGPMAVIAHKDACPATLTAAGHEMMITHPDAGAPAERTGQFDW